MLGFGKNKKNSNTKGSDDKLTEYLFQLIQLGQQKKYDEQLKLVESVFNKNTDVYWYNKGNVLTNLSRKSEALECYNEATRLDSRYVKAWYRKGNMLFDFKRYLESALCYEKVINLEQENKSKNNARKEWSGASAFSCMFAYLEECRNYIMAEKPVPQEMIQKRFYWTDKVKLFLEQNQITPKFDDMGQFLNYCRENYSNILDKLESNVIIEHKF